MATPNAITVYRGDDIVLAFTMNPVVNISGWTIVFTLKSQQGGGPVISQAATIVSAAAGTFSVALSHAQLTLPPATYNHDVHRTDSGSSTVLSIGPFVVQPEVLY